MIGRPIADAIEVTGVVLDSLSGSCHNITYCGELRRGLPLVTVIDLIARPLPARQMTLFGQASGPNLLWQELDNVVATGKAVRKGPIWGEVVRSFFYSNRPDSPAWRFNVHLSTLERWGCDMLTLTGPEGFALSVWQAAEKNRGLVYREGRLWDGATAVEIRHEANVFEAAGIPFIPAAKRSDKKNWPN